MNIPQMMIVALQRGVGPEHAGFLPSFLHDDDERSASEQFNERYISGWRPQEKFKYNAVTSELNYPGDPPLVPHLAIIFRDELILLYPYDYVAIVQKDGSFEACRMD